MSPSRASKAAPAHLPLTSIKHAGSPWEIGLAETHQTLVRERLRSRIVVQVDGGFRTGRDVVIGALLGADEFGFATAPLIAAGCIMMRKCHLNTCPVGVATQDPVLRKRFTGQPEHVINYFFFVAEEVREIMAGLGYRTFNEMVGQTQMLDQTKLVAHWKAKGLDFSKLFVRQKEEKGQKIYHAEAQNHHLEAVLDRTLIEKAQAALDRGAPVKIETEINNTDRSAGAMLSGTIAKIYGHAGLPLDTITVNLKGTAGQAFGAWLANGVTFDLEGVANDYVGKGLSGGRIIVKPPRNSGYRAGRVHHRRQHRDVWRDRGRMLFPRHRRRTLRRAQLRRDRRGRGRGRSLLRIHDRRHRRGARQDRTQLRGRHVGRHRLCAGRGRRLRQALQHGDGRTRAGAVGRDDQRGRLPRSRATSRRMAGSTCSRTCWIPTSSGCMS